MKRALFLSACLLLVSGCATQPPVDSISVSSQATSQAATAYSLPADPEHGALTHLAIGPLVGEGKILANGTAVVWMFEDRAARISIQLNIAAAPKGSAYIAWLQDPSDSSFEKLGSLANLAGDVRHSLKIEAQKDYKRYTSLIVTLESSEGVSTPGKIVANGILKETAR